MNHHNTMIEGTYKTAGGTVVAWLGTIGSFMTAAHEFLSLVCVVVSIIAGCYAIKVAIATLHSRRIEDAKNETTICNDCMAGKPPPFCPFEPKERPKNCIKNKEAK